MRAERNSRWYIVRVLYGRITFNYRYPGRVFCMDRVSSETANIGKDKPKGGLIVLIAPSSFIPLPWFEPSHVDVWMNANRVIPAEPSPPPPKNSC